MYTMLMAGINVSGRTATNLLMAGELETLTPEDIKTRIYGSKIVILLEQSMLILTWGIKVCCTLFSVFYADDVIIANRFWGGG